ncbi:MAG TPA: peptide deformylase [Candidatus Paceibacterota bacterium]|nr:peptide deformylase [Verrucomicrobiota bacterium]HRY49012.1 peptide deformylase [Candidatus Paceibacterota bacterium]HRZ99519.1 peptide deformylase [Candidatus Paceibacterota bacterium]
MLLSIVTYGHPILRKKGAKIDRITPEIRQLIEDMLETMHAAKGVGLAAQQVGKALQLAVIDVRGVTDRPSSLHLASQPSNVDDYMPVVLINPEISPLGPPQEGPEGCLSFPEIYNDVCRPESIQVKTLNRNGEVTEFQCGGLLSRAIQHETDHLNGILFIDRMTREKKDEIRPDLDKLQAITKAGLK